jgi:DNA-binding XRE family transcriptional regulator
MFRVAIVAAMATPAKSKPRLFLKEHREAKKVSASVMGKALGIERESVYRLEREQWRMDPDKQVAYALALGMEPQELWHPPATKPAKPSLDSLVESAPQAVRDMAEDIVRRLVNGRQ